MTKETVLEAINAAEKIPETLEQTVLRLALLPSLEYDRVREQEARALGVRVGTLDKEVAKIRNPDNGPLEPVKMFPAVDPWPDPVNGAALLDEIASTIRRFIICEPETVTAATLWIAFTWFIDRVHIAPLAVITAPEKRCGKSQLLDLIGRLSRRPLVASNISPAAIYRVIEAHGPTLLIDEADAFMKDNEDIRGILNCGHTRQAAYVLRVVGDDHEPKLFSTWGAKAISGIGALADTLMDRAVILELRRKLPHESVERLRHADLDRFQRLASMLARYSGDIGPAISIARPALPEILNDRAQDNWEPLLAIADNAGGEWPRMARDAAIKISGGADDALSLSAELLADIKEVFEVKRIERISTIDLLNALNVDEMKPWAAYNRGKPMAPRQLAKRLNEYGIKPQTIRTGYETHKGFQRAWFQDAFNRYLCPPKAPSDLSVTTSQNGESKVTSKPYAVTDDPARYSNERQNVTDKPLINNACYRVTDTEVI